jgi:hypothetical protein
MKYIAFAFCLWGISGFSLAGNDGITVHVLDKEFNIPSNCKFFPMPAVTAGEIRFNCVFYSPTDVPVIHFRKKEYCEKLLSTEAAKNAQTDKTEGDIRYVQWISKQEADGADLIWRVISGEEVCVYAVAFYEGNLDQLLDGLWQK